MEIYIPVEIRSHADNVQNDATANSNDRLPPSQTKHDELVQYLRDGLLSLVSLLSRQDENMRFNTMKIKVSFYVLQIELRHARIEDEEASGEVGGGGGGVEEGGIGRGEEGGSEGDVVGDGEGEGVAPP